MIALLAGLFCPQIFPYQGQKEFSSAPLIVLLFRGNRKPKCLWCQDTGTDIHTRRPCRH